MQPQLEHPIQHEHTQMATAMLRLFGCKCYGPLIGWRAEKGPRCRICNTECDLSKLEIKSDV